MLVVANVIFPIFPYYFIWDFGYFNFGYISISASLCGVQFIVQALCGNIHLPGPLQTSDGEIATSLMYADAVWDRVALEEDELGFGVGDAIEILNMTDDVWWYGSVNSANGWFPASFVRVSAFLLLH